MQAPAEVTIAIPVHNGAATIGEAVQSVIDQTFTNWQLYVHDNCSTDTTCEIVAAFGDERIKIVRHPEPLVPLGDSWSRCLTTIEGEFFLLLCADDRLHPDCLAAKLELAAAPGNESITLFSSNRMLINKTGQDMFSIGYSKQPRRSTAKQVFSSAWRNTNPIGDTGTGLVRTSAIDGKQFSFTNRYPFYVDMELWLQVLSHGDMLHLPRALSYFRVTGASISATDFVSNFFDSLRFYRQRLKPYRHNLLTYLFGYPCLFARAIVRQLTYLVYG